MAILENGTSNYFKVNLDDSFVQKNMVFASITIYLSEKDRQIEKLRSQKFDAFDANCSTLLQQLSSDERYSDLYMSFARSVKDIKDNRYSNGKINFLHAAFNDDVEQLLDQCGYRTEWVSQPIHIVSKLLVNCGKSDAEPLTSEYIYNKLKAKMSSDILDI